MISDQRYIFFLVQGHPSVRNSPAAGAIGLLAAKKTAEGIYIYFAHNTDSFVREEKNIYIQRCIR